MRWCSYMTPSGGPARLGAVSGQDDGRVLDVAGFARTRDVETPNDLVDLVESSPATQERVTELVRSAPADGVGWVRPDDVRYLAPLRAPGTLRTVVARDGAVPVFTHLSRRVVLGPDEDLTWPPYTERLAFGCQIAAVLGRGGRDLDPAAAVETVFGYVVMTQWTARDVAREVATSLGPWLVTPDEWEPRAGHAVTVAVDDELWISGTTDSRPWTFGQALSWLSQGEELVAGDIVGLGSGPEGCDRWVPREGTVTATVERLGGLSTHVVGGA